MTIAHASGMRGFFTSLSIICAVFPAASHGFAIGLPSAPLAVVEFYNVHLDHYFLTVNGDEMAAIDAGRAGPGWVRTGYGFQGYPNPPRAGCMTDCGVPVSRFYGTPGLGPNSHFFTAFADEIAALSRAGSNWTFERADFSIPLPDAAGRCAAGLEPVYRFYNNRWMFNDDNHRYVASAPAREKMRARGWIEEGVAFCTLAPVEVPLKSYAVQRWRDRILPSSQCEDEAVSDASCMAVDNLPVPDAFLQLYGADLAGPEFFDKTGLDVSGDATRVLPGDLSPAAASNVFVQGGGDYIMGIHVDTRSRGAAALSGVRPLYRFHTGVAAGASDQRFFPWSGPREDDVQLSLSFRLNVKRLDVRTPGGHAYGHPTIEFVDQRSGKHLYFTALTYGTVGQADILMRDMGTGTTIVGTTLRPENPYLRNLGTGTLALGSGFVSQAPAGFGGAFSFAMDRGEFQRVIDAARNVETALSPDPGDYLVASFQFKNEVFGDGEIGLNLDGLVLQLLHR
jgi:uncharacterized protein DUF5648